MSFATCQICGLRGLKSWAEYQTHHKSKHNVTIETGVPTLDFTELLAKPRQHVPMDKVLKQSIVERVETNMRVDAWQAHRLNPLIGTDKISGEPLWDADLNVL